MTRARMIDLMVKLSAAELNDFARQSVSGPPGDMKRLANHRPDLWVERVAELHSVIALAGRLPELALLSVPLQSVDVSQSASDSTAHVVTE